MKLELSFKENSQKLDMSFGQFQDVTDGGFERGYEQGLVDGKQVGFDNAISKLTEIEITENGRYTPENNSIGFSAVDVNIEGTEVIEQIIDESGVLDREGTVTEKVEQLIEKAEYENAWYETSKRWTDEFRYLLKESKGFKKMPRLCFDNAINIFQFLYESDVEEIDYYINSPKLKNCNGAFYKTSKLKRMIGIDISNVTDGDGFFVNSGIEEIDEPINPISIPSYAKMITFNGCNNLRKIRFIPESIRWSMKFSSAVLTAESIQSIINGLATVTTAQTLTLNSAIVLTDEQKATIQGKGWTLAQ
jgi:hypothetical protein